MKAFVARAAGPPDVLQLAEMPMPEPGSGQVRIKVAYCALTPIDVLARQGRVKWLTGEWPFTPGLEFSGVVDKVGPDADPRWAGRPVTSASTFGGCAEYALARADRIDLLEKALGWQVATAWRTPTLAAWFALNEAAGLKPNQTVLIHSAAGSVGVMATQIARAMGAKVAGVAGGPEKISFVRRFGADILLDNQLAAWPEQARRFTSDIGFDLIIDGNGGAAAQRNYQMIAPNGLVLYLGATSGFSPPSVSVELLIARSFGVAGFNLNAIPTDRIAAAEKQLVQKLRTGALVFPVTKVVDLSELPALHRSFEARELTGRTMIRVAGDL
jgi:NADPH2:quinone reductase